MEKQCELLTGRLVVAISGHYTAVIDGVIRDSYDPQHKTYWFAEDVPDSRHAVMSRVSPRCVYGYWKLL